MDLLERIKLTRIQLLDEEQEWKALSYNKLAKKLQYARQVLDEIIEWAEKNDLTPTDYKLDNKTKVTYTVKLKP